MIIGDYRTAIDADHVIIPQNIPQIDTVKKFKKMDNVTFGLKSFPITKLNFKIRSPKNLKKNGIKKILIFVSGSDPMQLSEKISHELKKKNIVIIFLNSYLINILI